MAFWNRENKEKAEDSDDESYYIDEKENGRSKLTSFIFGIAALLVTILIAVGVIFGARSIYRAVHGNNSPDTTNQNGGSNGKNGPSRSNKQSSKPSTSQNASGNASPSTTPSTGDNLPSTGDNVPLPKTGDPGM